MTWLSTTDFLHRPKSANELKSGRQRCAATIVMALRLLTKIHGLGQVILRLSVVNNVRSTKIRRWHGLPPELTAQVTELMKNLPIHSVRASSATETESSMRHLSDVSQAKLRSSSFPMTISGPASPTPSRSPKLLGQ